MIPPSHRSSRPCGFSLLEMIVVLAILASMMAVALPALFRPMAKSELHEAAKQVQAAFLETRSRAVESGIAQEFRYEPGGRRFEIRTCSETDDAGSSEGSASEAVAAVAAGGAGTPLRPAALEPVEDVLPEGVVFADPTETTAAMPYEVSFLAKPAMVEDEITGEQWSAPVRFYPNGRSLNTRLKLSNSKSWSVEILLRGLVGTALIGEPHSEKTDPGAVP